MPAKCLIYIRFSTLEQQQGASIDRQRELCVEHAERMGWDYEIAIDRGKSAFHGANREAGTVLGDFESATRRGDNHGRILLVERLDRISRLDWDETSEFLRYLNRNGVSVATVDGGRIYKAGEKLDLGELIELLVKIKLAHEASQDKQDKLKDKWRRHRDAAAAGANVTRTGPPWLTLSKDRKRWIPNADKVAVVRRMFELADSGLGSLLIARRLNDEGVPPWPRYEKRVPKAWDRKTIAKILSNEAVIGDKQFYEEDEAGKRVPSGVPIRGYYGEPIVPLEIYQRVNLAASDRKAVSGGKRGAVLNIASTLTKCAECGSSMTYLSGVRAGQVRVRNGKPLPPAPYDTGTLVCSSAHKRGGCENRTGIAYLGFERGLLDVSLHLSMDDTHFSNDEEVGRLSIEIADLERDEEIARIRSENLWRGYGASGSDIAMRIAQEADEKLKDIHLALGSLRIARDKAAGAADAEEQLSRVASLRDELYSDDLEVRRAARAKVAIGLRAIIEQITCSRERTATVEFKGSMRVAMITPKPGRAAPVVRSFDFSKGKASDLDVIDDPSDRARMLNYMRRNAAAKASKKGAES